jgi:hypothetical protein
VRWGTLFRNDILAGIIRIIAFGVSFIQADYHVFQYRDDSYSRRMLNGLGLPLRL